jgi:hypothetical protein
MNEKKIQKLFAAARHETAPQPPADFAADVLRAVRREPTIKPAAADTLVTQLNRLFPRVALAAAAVIAVCIAVDLGFTSAGLPGLDDGAAQLTSQFDLNGDEL